MTGTWISPPSKQSLPWKSCTNGTLTVPLSLNAVAISLRNCFPNFRRVAPASTLSNPFTLLTISAVYLLSLFLLHTYVRRARPVFPTTRFFVHIVAAHNTFLSLLSLYMLQHAIRAILQTVSAASSPIAGLLSTVCVAPPADMPLPIQRTMYIFLWSKVYELLDTPIIIARRKPLTFLHVYHHSSVFFEVWGWLDSRFSLGVYGMIFNCFVHFFMYAYYAAVLYRRRISAKVLITVTQIIQFLTGFVSVIPFLYLHSVTPAGCQGFPALYLSAAMNASYLVLFVIFFLKTYTRKRSKAPLKSPVPLTAPPTTPTHSKTQ